MGKGVNSERERERDDTHMIESELQVRERVILIGRSPSTIMQLILRAAAKAVRNSSPGATGVPSDHFFFLRDLKKKKSRNVDMWL